MIRLRSLAVDFAAGRCVRVGQDVQSPFRQRPAATQFVLGDLNDLFVSIGQGQPFQRPDQAVPRQDSAGIEIPADVGRLLIVTSQLGLPDEQVRSKMRVRCRLRQPSGDFGVVSSGHLFQDRSQGGCTQPRVPGRSFGGPQQYLPSALTGIPAGLTRGKSVTLFGDQFLGRHRANEELVGCFSLVVSGEQVTQVGKPIRRNRQFVSRFHRRFGPLQL